MQVIVSVGEDAYKNPATQQVAAQLAAAMGFAPPIVVVVDPAFLLLDERVNHFIDLQPNQPISSSLPFFVVLDAWMAFRYLGSDFEKARAAVEELMGKPFAP